MKRKESDAESDCRTRCTISFWGLLHAIVRGGLEGGSARASRKERRGTGLRSSPVLIRMCNALRWLALAGMCMANGKGEGR